MASRLCHRHPHQQFYITGGLSRRADAGKSFCHSTHRKRVEQSKNAEISPVGSNQWLGGVHVAVKTALYKMQQLHQHQ